MVLPEDLNSGTANDGERVLICGQQHVDTDLLKIGVVTMEKVGSVSRMPVYVCRKRLVLRGQTEASELAFSADLNAESKCMVLAGSGGCLEHLRIIGTQRCSLELIGGDWRISKSVLQAPRGWDAFNALGGSAVFSKCRLIGHSSVVSLYPVSSSGSDCVGSTQTHVTLEQCVIQEGQFTGICIGAGTSLTAKRCLFLRNGGGGSQPHIELFALLGCARFPKDVCSRIAGFIAHGLALETTASNALEDQFQSLGCVLQLSLRSTAQITNCKFGANGLLVRNSWEGPWYRWRADAPFITASDNVTVSGHPVVIENVMETHAYSDLAMCERRREESGRGLSPWGVSEEEEQEILRKVAARPQPPWLQLSAR